MKINFQGNYHTDIDTLKELVRYAEEIRKSNDEIIIFDFTDLLFFESNLTALLGALVDICHMNKKKVRISIPKNKDVLTIFKKNGFFYKLRVDGEILADHNDTVIAFEVFNKNDIRGYIEYLNKEIIPMIEKFTKDALLLNEIVTNLCEVFVNAFSHGNSPRVFVGGQFYPKLHKFNLTIVNVGTTIEENVSYFHKDKKQCPGNCIVWALGKGNSTRNDDKIGGLGLFLLSNFIKKNKYKFLIYSGSECVQSLKNNIDKHNELDIFSGTLVNIELVLNENNLVV